MKDSQSQEFRELVLAVLLFRHPLRVRMCSLSIKGLDTVTNDSFH